MSKHVPGRINLDVFGGMLSRLAVIGAIVLVVFILPSGIVW